MLRRVWEDILTCSLGAPSRVHIRYVQLNSKERKAASVRLIWKKRFGALPIGQISLRPSVSSFVSLPWLNLAYLVITSPFFFDLVQDNPRFFLFPLRQNRPCGSLVRPVSYYISTFLSAYHGYYKPTACPPLRLSWNDKKGARALCLPSPHQPGNEVLLISLDVASNLGYSVRCVHPSLSIMTESGASHPTVR